MISYEAVQVGQGRDVQWTQHVVPGMWYVLRTSEVNPALWRVVDGPYAGEKVAEQCAIAFTKADDRCKQEPEPRTRLARARSKRHADRIAEALNRMDKGAEG